MSLDCKPRLTPAASLLPMLLGSYSITSYMLLKGTGFGIGFGFFGDPIISPGLQYVNNNFPKWVQWLEMAPHSSQEVSRQICKYSLLCSLGQ